MSTTNTETPKRHKGEHKGYRVIDLWDGKPAAAQRGKRWLFQAYDGERETYKSKRFANKNDGNAWLTKTSARLATGLEQSGRVPMASSLTAYLADMERRKVTEEHRAEAKTMLERVMQEANLGDLIDKGAKARVRTFLTSLKSADKRRGDKLLSAARCNAYLTALNGLANWLVGEEALVRNPFASITPAKVPDALKATFSIEEIRTILRTPADDASLDHTRRKHARAWTPEERALMREAWLQFAIATYTGLRDKEALWLDWSKSFDWEGRMLFVRLPSDAERDAGYEVKGNKERMVPIQVELDALLRQKANLAGYVFSERFRTMSHVAHQRWFKRLLQRYGIERGRRSNHSARHTWISLMLATGVNASLVQAYAGHAYYETTNGYAKVQTRYVGQVESEAWPRGRFYLRDQLPSAPKSKPKPKRKTG
jgi:integrase